MEDHSQSVMVALLPVVTDWVKIEYPHLTLVYAGEASDLTFSDRMALAKVTSDLAALANPFQVRVWKRDVFGKDENKVDVIRVYPNEQLSALRSFLHDWDKSEHPFNPHVTVGPEGTVMDYIPNAIAFDRISFSWGNERLTFSLRSGYNV